MLRKTIRSGLVGGVIDTLGKSLTGGVTIRIICQALPRRALSSKYQIDQSLENDE